MAPSLEQMTKDNAKAIGELSTGLTTLVKKLESTPALNQPSPGAVFGQPGLWNIRKGENPLSSRGFSFMKMLGLLSGGCEPQDAKIEIDIHNRLNQVYC